MAVTPLIRPLQSVGGSFYTFVSAQEDLSKTFSNSDTKFKFSKFVLLNIPNVATPNFQNNTLQFGAVDGHLLSGLSSDQNVNLAQSFQNYCLNLETMLVSRPGYDRTSKLNVTERVFWKWLKELGALRFEQANSMQTTRNTQTDRRYAEEPDTTVGQRRYSRVVQYVGDIDIVNSVQNEVNAYTELYIHVPTNDGYTPLVLFKSLADQNYPEGLVLDHRPTDPLNNEIIFGRNYFDQHPANLSINAYFDQDTLGSPQSLFFNPNTQLYDIPQNWYDPLVGPNAYFTEQQFGQVQTDKIKKVLGIQEVVYERTRLDGILIDFDPNSYTPIVNNPSISTIGEFNSTVDANSPSGTGNFEFNAVMVYYDVYDPNDQQDFATNLYGVLFLEDVEQLGGEFGIPRFKKFIPNKITKTNGNSYGFKINIKFDTSADNTGVERAVNDFSSFSMDLFVDVLNVLQQAAQTINDQAANMIGLSSKVAELEDLVLTSENTQTVTSRLAALEQSFEANQALFQNSQVVLGLINKNADQIADILANRTSIEVAYNIDAVKPGSGIQVDRDVPNVVTINNTVQGMSIPRQLPYQGNVSSGAQLQLQPYSNYFRHFSSGQLVSATGDILLDIDDQHLSWSRGQTMRLSFEDPIDMGPYNLIVRTDSQGQKGQGPYGVVVMIAGAAEFDPSNDRPVFDITCVDEQSYTFIVDQIR